MERFRAMSSSDMPNATPVACVLSAHGAFLAACGIYGSYLHNWKPNAMHSAYAGIGGCVALLVSAGLSAGGTKKLYMIGVHAGLALQLIFTGPREVPEQFVHSRLIATTYTCLAGHI